MVFKESLEPNCFACVNRQCVVQQFCSPGWIELINSNKNLTKYRKGQYIFREGETVPGVYLLLHGKVKITSSGANNREQIVRFAADGHILGFMSAEHEVLPLNAVALEETSACFIDNTTLQRLFMNSPEFTYELMMYYAKELRQAELRLRYMGQMTLREKIAECLICVLEIFGEDNTDGTLGVTLSRQELADVAGTTSEQATRALTEFENEALIAKSGKKIAVLNPDGLRNIVAAHHKIKPAVQ